MPKDIGKTLKECRASARMSVKQISDLLTLKGYKASESTIYSWENGNSQPTPGALLTMCRAYGIDDVLSAFGYDGYKEDGSLILNMYEIEIIEKYRTLDEHGKEMVDFTLLKEWERISAEREKQNSIVKMPVPEHLLAVAARNDYIAEEGEVEKTKADIAGLKRPD